jgi:Helicase HerA, central domain
MKHLIGMNDAKWRQSALASPVVLDTDGLINGHMLFAGMSGTGKSYQIQGLLNACAREGVAVDVFDVHEELEGSPKSRCAKFSEATKTGFNPLVINQDPHSGGARKQIATVVDMINRTSRQLGPRQESALRNLIGDVYYLRGIYADSPQSWLKREITEDAYDQMIRARDYQGLRQYYPILRDVISYAERKLKTLATGGDGQTLNALERVEATTAKITNLLTRANKAASDDEITRLQDQLDREKEKAVEAYAAYVRSIETGREFQDILKYTSKDTLISVLERLHALQNAGIFCSNAPRFDDALIRVYQVGSLSDDERRLLFYNRSQQILRECMDEGKSSKLKRIVLVDEGHLYYSEDGDNPMNRIAKEGRKFGLGLVVGSQSPTHFSEDFLTNCGTVFLLGIHEQYWDMACRKLKIDQATLRATRAREVLSVKMHIMGEASARFQTVNVDQRVVERGLQAIRAKPAAVTA